MSVHQYSTLQREILRRVDSNQLSQAAKRYRNRLLLGVAATMMSAAILIPPIIEIPISLSPSIKTKVSAAVSPSVSLPMLRMERALGSLYAEGSNKDEMIDLMTSLHEVNLDLIATIRQNNLAETRFLVKRIFDLQASPLGQNVFQKGVDIRHCLPIVVMKATQDADLLKWASQVKGDFSLSLDTTKRSPDRPKSTNLSL